ncbi:uncharacterized protein LOC131952939 [Physella acuta]|uniref:uncharacterized protein LOC131952939 n=1 Tax=Physella acuta TaxID=109671 RepID=UPI0027DE3399|nr:uncharacterized protein LOC131952939 [Physella acuta]
MLKKIQCNFHIVLHLIIFCHLLGIHEVNTAEVRVGSFINANSSWTILPLGVEPPALNVLSCATSCLSYGPLCRSFAFGAQRKQCRLGSWLVLASTTTINPDEVTYTMGDFCNTALNFTVVYNGNFSICLWVNRATLTYANAKLQCENRGGHMYTPKTRDRYDIIQQFFTDTNVWIGLSDAAQNGVYRWEDDQSVINADWKIQIFTNYPPYPALSCIVYTTDKLLMEFNCNAIPYPSLLTAAPSHPIKASEPCTEMLDIVLVLDYSTSIGPVNWNYVTQLSANITQYFDVGPDKARFATMTFNREPTVQFNLKDHLDHDSLTRHCLEMHQSAYSVALFFNFKALLAIAYPGVYGTKTYLALQDIINKNMFGAPVGGRDYALNIVIVITDGESDEPLRS